MLYFAYGSNMNWEQMRERCPSAQFVSTAVLPEHQLAFTRKSVKRNCGVADILPVSGHAVWGVVFEIEEHDIGKLDASEGFQSNRAKNSYWRRECVVYSGGIDGPPMTVSTYFADPQPNPPQPNEAYKRLILAGARQWRLPDYYIDTLMGIEVAG